MKQVLCILLAISLAFSICACGKEKTSIQEENSSNADTPIITSATEKDAAASTTDPGNGTSAEKENEAQPSETEAEKEEIIIDDPAWDELVSLGKIETENGLLYVTITVPANLVNDETTQESIDKKAGENYTSGVLNEDGSVTYKMTKKQHKAMLDSISESIDQTLKEWINSPEYAIQDITANSDYTSFDVKLSTERLGLAESFMALGFYMLGGMYGVFSGNRGENIEVNYYSVNGDLLNTANSSAMSN